MAGHGNGRDYREARQRSAMAIVGLVIVIILLDSLDITGSNVDPLVLTPLLLFAAGLLSVDLTGLGR